MDELEQAAGTYRALAQNLSRRLASAAARAEDQPRIAQALTGASATAQSSPRMPPTAAPRPPGSPAATR